MFFFQHPRVKFAMFSDTIHKIWDFGKRGTMVFKLNIFQRIFGYLMVILNCESKHKSTIRNKEFYFYFLGRELGLDGGTNLLLLTLPVVVIASSLMSSSDLKDETK